MVNWSSTKVKYRMGKVQSVQYMEMGKVDICMQKKEIGPLSHIIYKNQLKNALKT